MSLPEQPFHDARENESPPLNILTVKAIAMKLRHNVHGQAFKKPSTRSGLGDSLLGKSGESRETLQARQAGDAEAAYGVSGLSRSADSARESPDNLEGLKTIFLHPFSLLLVGIPLGVASAWLKWGNLWSFLFNFLALVPLAKILGDATEELSAGLNSDTISGLLNATFGNAVEMIVAVFSIRQGLIEIVKNSLLGSVLSNILLVLGSSLFLGGFTVVDRDHPRGKNWSIDEDLFQDQIKDITEERQKLTTMEKEQKFPMKSAQTGLSMLLLACMTFALPTIFQAYPTDNRAAVLLVSRIGSVLIMSTYIMSLIFMMYTHRRMLQRDEGGDEEDDDDEGAALSVRCSIFLMCVTTVVVSFVSELLVDSIKGLVSDGSVPAGFIGVILLPIAGNACEHAGALRFAMKDRPGLALSIAVGSSSQVALLVVPFSVIMGFFLNQPMDLDFGVMGTSVMLLSVVVVQALLADGRSNWLKGYMMVVAYVFIAVLYWFLPQASSISVTQEL